MKNWKSCQNFNCFFFFGQSLVTKLVVVLDYRLSQYLFVGGKFWQIHYRITSSFILLILAKFLEN